MVIVMEKHTEEAKIEKVVAELIKRGFDVHRSTGADQTVLGVVGDVASIDPREFEVMDGVQEAVRVSEPYKLSSRTFKRDTTVVKVNGCSVGGKDVVVMAGPCTIENEKQLFATAEAVARAGAKVLRGGAYKPRTSPYAFQGMGVEGLKLLQAAGKEFGLGTVSEVMEISQIEKMMEYVDILQVGARNMQNFNLLSALGQVRKPILLKRGMSATVQEWLLAAEYIMSGGNYQIILCERGIRTFDTYLRNTLDIAAIPVVQKLSHLPIIVDPSHATGRRDKVMPMARASVAAGADGLLIEVHVEPDKALCDGPQSLYPEQFVELMDELRIIVPAVRRTLP
ncbi:MAG TPA: 3-deoxy-7-phosphoheptulonate synthase [Thermoanaerobaculia bacterium]|jgi:3-deoxy-7-phosphoheptulonate synthase|nr:3-deoxy-7-phosphoheptulonate synthase [Thermoanaerobaculia bacterium]